MISFILMLVVMAFSIDAEWVRMKRGMSPSYAMGSFHIVMTVITALAVSGSIAASSPFASFGAQVLMWALPTVWTFVLMVGMWTIIYDGTVYVTPFEIKPVTSRDYWLGVVLSATFVSHVIYMVRIFV